MARLGGGAYQGMDDNLHRIVAIGGSAGAIGAVKRMCASMPSQLPAAVCIVVHVGSLGDNLLASILNDCCPFPVHTAEEAQKLEAGKAYVAPADHHLLVMDGVIRLGHGPRENMARPAIDRLFRSVGLAYGPRAIGVVLTGMLNDGASGLADLRRCGGVTLVQNPSDAVEAEMPLEALRSTDVDYRAAASEIGDLITSLLADPPSAATQCPDSVRLEVDIALGRPIGAAEIAKIGGPSTLSCPDCSGVFTEIRQAPPLRFRCQVGHAYTGEALDERQQAGLDDAMRVALRIVEERAVLADKMARQAHRTGMRLSAADYDKRAAEARRHADVLREAIRKYG